MWAFIFFFYCIPWLFLVTVHIFEYFRAEEYKLTLGEAIVAIVTVSFPIVNIFVSILAYRELVRQYGSPFDRVILEKHKK